MSKSRSFSIYLLKPGISANNALKENNNLCEVTALKKLPENSKLFLLDNIPTPVWWRAYFGIEQELDQVLKGAILFIDVDNRCFAITFGHVSHNIKDACYEYDFGLRVTLNSVDPQKLKSLDTLDPSNARRQRIQLPLNSDLTYFDFDRDSTILKGLTGKVKDKYKVLFKHSTGSSNIRISSDIEPDGLHKLCQNLLILYSKDTYLTEFPNIQNIVPVKDPEKLAILNNNLIAALREKSEDLTLTIPEIINYIDGLSVAFSGEGKGKIYEDIYIGHYYEYLENSQFDFSKLELEILKKHHLELINEDQYSSGTRPNMLKCLLFDTVLEKDNETYHLCEGNWYLVDRNYVSELSNYLDALCVDTTLPSYNHDNEGAFNEFCASTSTLFLCLDKSNISPQGQKQIEPCDIVEIIKEGAILHHVKRSTVSATISHLFNQGLNSIRLIRDESEALENLLKLIKIKFTEEKDKTFLQTLNNKQFKIVYQIISHKDKTKKSVNLPLFSRISLKRTMKELKRMGLDAEYCFIKDETLPSVGKNRDRKQTKHQV